MPALSFTALAQETEEKKITVSGSIQSDILIPQDDDAIGTEKVNEWALTNTFADVNVMSEHVDAGARFEFLKHPYLDLKKIIEDGAYHTSI